MGRTKQLILGLFLLLSGSVLADDSFNENCTNNQNCFNEDDYIYESGQPLIDLYNQSGTTNLNSGDDQWSSSVTLGNTWNRWGLSWNKARMSTNGCVNFVGRSDGKNSSNCNDYTPQALPYRNYTLYPFWTDLIRGQSSSSGCNNTFCTSKMLFKAFDDYVVFGWYYMKEYNRQSSNSFEVILWNNDTYDYRYRELDIIQHDVLIGEQGASNEKKTYLFYNDNQSGYNNFDQFLAGYGGPDIENGGSLYSEGLTLEQQCNIDPLYSTECSGYATAYFNQQCGLDALHDEQCPGYAAAYLTQQCGLDPLYSEDCTGFAAAFFTLQCNLDPLYDSQCDGYWEELAYQESLNGDDEEDYGMGDDDFAMYGYDDQEEYEELMFGYTNNDEYGYEDFDYSDGSTEFVEVFMYDEDLYNDEMDSLYGDNWQEFTEEDWYEIDVEEFGQEQVDQWYGEDVEFTEEGMIDWQTVEMPEPEDLVALLDSTDVFILEQEVGVEIFREEEWEPVEEFAEEFIEEEYIEILEDLEREELEEFVEAIEEAFEEEISEDILEELLEDEAFEELINEEELESLLNDEPEELFEEEQELIEEEELLDETVEEITPAEVSSPTKTDSRPSRSSMVVAKLKRELGAAANVVSQQIQDGSSGGGSQGGSSTQGGASSSGSSGSSGSSIAQSTGDSFAQDQQEQLSGTLQVDVQVEVVDSGPAVSAFEVAEQQQEQTQQQEFTFESGDSFGSSGAEFADRFDEAFSSGQSLNQFLSNEAPDFSSFDVAPPSVSEKRATKAVENLAERVGEEAAQEQLAAQFEANQDSGGFDDQTVAVAVIGYKPGFSAYTGMEQINDQQNWYQVKALYTNAKINDNKGAFYRMAGSTEQKLKTMINSQYEEN